MISNESQIRKKTTGKEKLATLMLALSMHIRDNSNLHRNNNWIFSKKRSKFLIHLGEELPRWSSTLSIQKKHAIKPQRIRKSTTATEKQAQKTKKKQKNRRYLCKRSTYQKCIACDNNILKLFACIAITSGLKALFCSFLNSLKL